MSRALTSGMVTAVAATVVQPILLAQFAFDSGTVYIWSGYGTLVWGGNSYLGAGNFCGVAPVSEVLDNSAQGTSFTLNGIPSSLLSLALTESYQGRSAKLYLGAMDSSGAVIADPYLIFGGRMDTMTVEDSGETGSITLTAENNLIDLNRSRERRYTDQDQKIEYPTDRGMEYITSLQSKEIVWGAATSKPTGGADVVGPNPSVDTYQ